MVADGMAVAEILRAHPVTSDPEEPFPIGKR